MPAASPAPPRAASLRGDDCCPYRLSPLAAASLQGASFNARTGAWLFAHPLRPGIMSTAERMDGAPRAQADAPPLNSRYYAGRFAGKEAVAKALGTGFAGDITWRGIEILRRESGAPYVRLSDEVLRFAESLGITDWFISISHCGEITTASAIAIGE